MSLQHIISGKGRERPFPEGFAEVTLFNSNEYSLFYAKDDLNHRLLVDSLKKEKRDLSDLQVICCRLAISHPHSIREFMKS